MTFGVTSAIAWRLASLATWRSWTNTLCSTMCSLRTWLRSTIRWMIQISLSLCNLVYLEFTCLTFRYVYLASIVFCTCLFLGTAWVSFEFGLFPSLAVCEWSFHVPNLEQHVDTGRQEVDCTGPEAHSNQVPNSEHIYSVDAEWIFIYLLLYLLLYCYCIRRVRAMSFEEDK